MNTSDHAKLFDTAFGVTVGTATGRKAIADEAAAVVEDVLQSGRDANDARPQLEALLGSRGASLLIDEGRRLRVSAVGKPQRWRPGARPSISILTGKATATLAAGLFDRLAAAGAEVWFYEKSIKLGRRIRAEDERALQAADYVVLLVSRAALKSNFVGYELDVVHWLEMKDRRERLLPVIADDLPFDELPPILGAIEAMALRDTDLSGVVRAIADRIDEDRRRK